MEGVPEERIATNNATFREANERISAAAGSTASRRPSRSSVMLRSKLLGDHSTEPRRVRGGSSELPPLREHPGPRGGIDGSRCRRGATSGYSIVEKIGRAGEIVDALDERRAVGKPPAAPAE